MQVSFSQVAEGDRQYVAIGRIKARTGWRAAAAASRETERQAAIRALMREAEDFGADAIVDVSFSVDAVNGSAAGGVELRRIVATGLAVRFALAA